jgi:hypothetical protein
MTFSQFNTTQDEEDWGNNYLDEVGYQPLRAAPGASREDKKMHYYLEMIRKQEEAEKKKIQRKEAKTKNQNKPENKNLNFESEPKQNECIKFTLVDNFDPEIDNLAYYMHQEV